jgi:hypothetical protein
MTNERAEETEVSKALERRKDGIRLALFSSWRSLLWEPEERVGEEACVSFEDGSRKVAIFKIQSYLGERSSLCRLVDLDLQKELDAVEYPRLASQAETSLKELYEKQLAELNQSPEGKDILWWPGQSRFGKRRSEYRHYTDNSKDTHPVIVRAKNGNLFCFRHLNTQIVSRGHLVGQDEHAGFWECPQLKCSFSILGG